MEASAEKALVVRTDRSTEGIGGETYPKIAALRSGGPAADRRNNHEGSATHVSRATLRRL